MTPLAGFSIWLRTAPQVEDRIAHMIQLPLAQYQVPNGANIEKGFNPERCKSFVRNYANPSAGTSVK